MNKDVKFLTVIMVFSSLLLLSSAHLIEFHKWFLSQSQNQQSSINKSSFDAMGIHSIIHTEPVTSASPIYSNKNNKALDLSVLEGQGVQTDDYLKPFSGKDVSEAQTKNIIDNSLIDKQELVFSESLIDSVFFAETENEILIEFSGDLNKEEKKRIISRLLTLSAIPDVEFLVANNAINTRKKPYYYKQVFNQFKVAIRYPAQAYRYADYLLENSNERFLEDGKSFELVRIPRQAPKIPKQIEPYHHWVKQYAQQYRIEPELVYGVMKTESAFNPKAVSKSNALGLMQIKQKAAGKDVYKYIDNKAGYPSKTTLFNPQENIRIGIAYMGLLKDKYLQQIRNPESKELLMIASYNGGLSKAFEVFGDTPSSAVQRINQLYPKNIYRKLVSSHQSAETRSYIDKVLNNKKEFAKLLELIA